MFLDYLCYGLNLALRAGQEHRNERTGPNSQIKILKGESGRKYIQYNEDVSKYNSGGLHSRKMKAKCIRVYENTDMSNRCQVAILEKYLSLRWRNFKRHSSSVPGKNRTNAFSSETQDERQQAFVKLTSISLLLTPDLTSHIDEDTLQIFVMLVRSLEA
ncbi:uncharacterized protein LOC117341902 [Pecten maximus]|uniref:uncharacterized protein LOC117341902 n=1 Tax=Pecten maximus TaxID=6579 RepID=UPI001458551A|nr:uncharacterized protein LOC117341902 [Pecten maximus]